MHKQEVGERIKQIKSNQNQYNQVQEKLNRFLELGIVGEIQPNEYATKKEEYRQL